MSESKAIVTALDAHYLWGAFLLIASLRYHHVTVPIHVLAYGLNEEEKRLLSQFPDVEVFDLKEFNFKHFVEVKPLAILTCNQEYISWMDADCIVTGDVTEYLVAPGESFQVCLRGREEQLDYFGGLLEESERNTEILIPQKVLSVWKKDVGESEQLQIRSTFSTCSFTLHRKHFDFIRKWLNQMEKVFPSVEEGFGTRVTDKRSIAYRNMDESVINSLFAYAKNPPSQSEYLLDKDPSALLVHFVLRPKPWQLWLPQYMKYYDSVISLVRWAESNNYQTPKIPFALNSRYKYVNFALGYCYNFFYHLAKRCIRFLAFSRD